MRMVSRRILQTDLAERTAQQAIASLEAQTDVPFVVYDRVVAEPSEESWQDAITWSREQDCSHFLA